MWLKIEQNGPEITILWRDHYPEGNEEVTTSKFRIGSDDNENQIHGAPMKSSARWQDSSLAVDSVAMFGHDRLQMNDLWTLSQDGQTLTFQERHQFAAEPAAVDRSVFERQPDASWEQSQDRRPAEEVYKNIQVMRGLPASQLPAAMAFFARSLGVNCGHCHVPNEFEKDDKPSKATARRMLTMVHQINESNFAPDHPVSCWTCHRGNVKPESLPK